MPVLSRGLQRSSARGARRMCFGAAAAVASILLIAPECRAASKITSWEIGKVLEADQ